jgi:hypothetical protein
MRLLAATIDGGDAERSLNSMTGSAELIEEPEEGTRYLQRSQQKIEIGKNRTNEPGVGATTYFYFVV